MTHLIQEEKKVQQEVIKGYISSTIEVWRFLKVLTNTLKKKSRVADVRLYSQTSKIAESSSLELPAGKGGCSRFAFVRGFLPEKVGSPVM